MARSEAEIVERPPILLIILVPALIGFFGPIWQLLISSFPYWIVGSLGESICNIGMSTAPFLSLLLCAPIYRSKSIRDRFGIKTMAYLYVSSLVASYFINFPWALGQRYLYASRYVEMPLADIIPSFMCPPADVCQRIVSGGPIDWSAWSLPIAWFWVENVTMGLFLLSVATLFRRLWIDVENVPFPQTLVAFEFARNNALDRGWGKMFLLGIIVGLAFEIPVVLTGLFPWFPDIYGVRINTCPHVTRYFVSGDILATIPGMMSANYNPPVLAMAYLAPLHVLFSTWFFAIVYMVAVQIAYTFGYYTGITEKGTCGRMWCPPTPNSDPPLKFMAIATGALLMMGIMHLVLNRKYVVETFRAAQRGMGDYKDEAISYRTCYAMMAITLVAVIAFWMASTLTFVEAVLMPVTAFAIWYPMTRMYGLAGAYWRSADKGLIFYRLLYPQMSRPPTAKEFLIFRTAVQSGSDTPSYPWGAAAFSTFASYKFAKLAGVSARNTFITLLAALMIAPLASHLGFLTILHGVGGRNIGMWKSWFESIGERISQMPDWWSGAPAAEPWVEYTLAGLVISAALSFLRSRFIWFPLEPIGFVLGITSSSSLFGLWLPFLVAWVLKTIT
ncbi:MAG: hypothetical protein JTT11_00760, partial [Candidatus Brockarchaeota archaeon]|nr:hypothetical protein [Candidatus Brockarchaeota archaeon]